MRRATSPILLAVLFLAASVASAAPEGGPPRPGGRSVTDWIADLASGSPEVRAKALGMLQGQAAHTKAAIPAVIGLLSDPEERIASEALWFLAAHGADAKAAMPVLWKRVDKEPPGSWTTLRIAQAMLAVTGGADMAVVRLALPLRTIKGGFPLVDNGVVEGYAKALAIPLIELLADSDPKIRAQAAETLGLYGYARDPSKGTPLAAAGDAGKGIAPALDKALDDRDPAVRAAAALALAAVVRGDPAAASDPVAHSRYRPVIIALLHAKLVEPHPASEALRATLSLSVAPLVEALPDPQGGFILPVAQVLGLLGPEARPLIEAALRHKDPGARQGVAFALQQIGDPGSLPALHQALGDGDAGVRLAAAEAAIHISAAKAAPVVPALAAIVAQGDEGQRRLAATLLARVPRVAGPAAPALRKALGDKAAAVRLASAHALVAIDPAAAEPAVAVLVADGLGSGSDDQAMAAADLGRVGAPAKESLPALRKLLSSQEHTVLIAASLAVAKIDPTLTPESVAALAAALDARAKPRSRGISPLLRALAGFGARAAPAIPALTKALAAHKQQFEAEIAGVLLRIDADNPDALAYYKARIPAPKDKSEFFEAAESLKGIGAAGARFVPDLRTMLADKDAYVRGHTADLLASIGVSAKDALPDLRARWAAEQHRWAKGRMERAIRVVEGGAAAPGDDDE